MVMGVGKWFGYVLFGFLADSVGRRRSYVAYLLVAAVLVPIYGLARSPTWLFVLGPFVAFFGTRYFSGLSPLTAGLFPPGIPPTPMGRTYNLCPGPRARSCNSGRVRGQCGRAARPRAGHVGPGRKHRQHHGRRRDLPIARLRRRLIGPGRPPRLPRVRGGHGPPRALLSGGGEPCRGAWRALR